MGGSDWGTLELGFDLDFPLVFHTIRRLRYAASMAVSYQAQKTAELWPFHAVVSKAFCLKRHANIRK